MSVVTTTEVELKYAVPAGAAVPDLDAIGAVRSEPVAHLQAVYLDTADRVLLAARIAVRRRTGGHDAGWHVKLPAATGRIELQAPIDPASPDRLPAEFERALRSRVRGAALVPLARIDTERTALVVEGGGGRVEVVDDLVRAVDPASGVRRSWREWEAERLGSTPEDDALLGAVDVVLRAAGATASASPAKLAQALGGDAPPASGSPVAPAGTAGTALVAVLAPLAEQAHRQVLTLALHGDEDGSGVHGLRKTLRRIRSVLSLRRVAGPLGAEVRARLGALAGVLGEARDPLIAAGLAERLLADLPQHVPGVAETRAALVDGPRQAVPAAVGRAVEALLDEPALAAWALLDRLLQEGPDGRDAGAEPRRLVEAAQRAHRRTLRRAAGTRRSADLAALHAVRKAAKRSRAVAEGLAGAGLLKKGSPLARSVPRARRAQEALGEHRDLALLLAALPEASARISAAGGNAYAAGLLAARAERRLDRLERTARRSMKALRR